MHKRGFIFLPAKDIQMDRVSFVPTSMGILLTDVPVRDTEFFFENKRGEIYGGEFFTRIRELNTARLCGVIIYHILFQRSEEEDN